MNKSTLFFGIDIAKDSFDIYSESVGYKSYPNTKEGFKLFFKTLELNSFCIMEATGCI